MFRKIAGWFGGGGGGAQDHYNKESAKGIEDFHDNVPLPYADNYYGGDEPEFEAEPLPIQEPRIELIDFDGASEDIEWMTYNHDTGETIIQFLEHGERTRHAHAYSYKNIPYVEFVALSLGSGPFPHDRYPYYQKEVSVGQAANFYIRNDHVDDLYEYERLEPSE